MIPRKPSHESGPMTCTRCGHVTPYIKGWMLSAVTHHQIAVHGADMKLLRKR